MCASKSRILLADPDPDVRQALQLYFEVCGHQVETMFQGQKILARARPWQPNVILISDQLNDVDPYATCEVLLSNTLTSHIPIILLTHVNDRQTRLKALEVGVSDVVAKPFDVEELRLRVEASIKLTTGC